MKNDTNEIVEQGTTSNSTVDIDTQEMLPILPIRNVVAFPHMQVPAMISSSSAALIEAAHQADRPIGLLTIKDANVEHPVPGQIYEVGTIAKVLHAELNDNGVMVAVLNGIRRFKVGTWQSDGSDLKASVVNAPELVEPGIELEALQRQLKADVLEVLAMTPNASKGAAEAISRIEDPLQLAYVTAFNMKLDTEARQKILALDSVSQKIRELLGHLLREKEMLAIGQKIQSEVKEKMNKSQRDFYLRQQLKAIKKELGETDTALSEAETYAERIAEAVMSDEARDQANREQSRLEQMSPQSAEYPIIKTYLDWLLDLPWAQLSEDSANIADARRILDEDHHGLEEIKTRLVEYIAVRQLIKGRERDEKAAEEKNRLINAQEKEIVAYHELGHAIVAMALPGTDPVQKVSIIPRGIAALGYTMQVPTEDRFLMRKTELNHRIATLLGGRAAEALIFNDISTGAQNDLSRATDIARSMVTQYGMSDRLGQVYFAQQQPPQFLAAMGETRGQYSDETANTIDEEVKGIIDDQYQIALQILKDNRMLLAETAGQLLQDEVIDGDDLTVLAEAVKPVSNALKSNGAQADPADMAA